MQIILFGAQWGDEGYDEILPAYVDGADVVAVASDDASVLRAARQAAVDGTVLVGSEASVNLERVFTGDIDDGARLLVSSRAHVDLPSYEAFGSDTVVALRAAGEGVRMHQILDGSLPTDLSEEDIAYVRRFQSSVRDHIVDGVEFARRNFRKNVLHIGPPGFMRDPDFGYHPPRELGSRGAATACRSAALGPSAVDRVVAVCKAYASVPENAPNPSQIMRDRDAPEIERFRDADRQGEGDATETPTVSDGRSYGVLDLVALRYACAVNSADGIAITRLDTLAGLDTIRVCVAYENDRGSIATVPESLAELEGYRAVTKSLDGWSESLSESTRFEELPGAVHDFLGFVEDVTETPVEVISASPGTRIVRRKIWTG